MTEPSIQLEKLLKKRHAVRKFLPTPVPKHIIEEALELAQLAPSHANTQPWRLFIVSDSAKDRVKAALLNEAKDPANWPKRDLPNGFMRYVQELGAKMYGALGVARDDEKTRFAISLRNYEFYGAPMAGFVCMPAGLSPGYTASVGVWLQTLMLALAAKGVATCPQGSLATFPHIVRREVPQIGEELEIICGLSIGYEDVNAPVNKFITGRDSYKAHVTFIDG